MSMDELRQEIESLKRQIAAINLDTQVKGMFEVVSSPPSGTPHDLFDQVKLYVSGTTYRLYCYDWNNHAWHYATLT